MLVSDQEHSQTFGPLRAPALGRGESQDAWNNPLLWRFGRYRTYGRLRISRSVLEHAVFGLLLSGLIIALCQGIPKAFSLQDFDLIASVAVGLHVLWTSHRMGKRMAFLKRDSFLDELLLTEMTPREITGAIAQSVSRPILASLSGVLLPLYLICASKAIAGSQGQRFYAVLWGLLAPFLVLMIFSIPWLCIRKTLLPAGKCWSAGAIIILWLVALPASAVIGNPLAPGIVAGVLLVVTIGFALHVGPGVPALLANRET